MAGTTSIEWTEKSWNPIAGCKILSKGCRQCYAMGIAGRLEAMRTVPHYQGLTEKVNGRFVWSGKIGVAGWKTWLEPLRWTKPAKIFVNSMSDLGYEGVSDEIIYRALAVMALSCQEPHRATTLGWTWRRRHIFQILTKRPARLVPIINNLAQYSRRRSDSDLEIHPFSKAVFEVSDQLPSKFARQGLSIAWSWVQFGFPGLWLGTSVEDEHTARVRLPVLLYAAAPVLWVSVEPMLGQIRLTNLQTDDRLQKIDALRGNAIVFGRTRPLSRGLNWVVVGGESGNGARPMNPDWVRSLRDECRAADVPFFFKQWGHFNARGVAVGKYKAGRVLDGRTWNQEPVESEPIE